MPDTPLHKSRDPLPPPTSVTPASLPYVELDVTSNFSFLRGASHPDELVFTAATLGYRAIAIADRNTLAGVVRAHVAARQCGLKLVVGARLAFPDAPELLVFCPDRAAYGRLCRLITLGKRRVEKGHFDLRFAEFLELGRGLLVVADVQPTVLSSRESPETLADSLRPLHLLRECFGEDLSLLVNLVGEYDHALHLDRMGRLASRLRVPLLAGNAVHYHDPSRRELQDILTCIREGCTIEQAGLRLFQSAERYLKSPAEMHRLFADCPRAIHRAVELADRCRFSLDELKYEYPDELAPPGMTPMQYLASLAWEGAAERYPDGIPGKVRQQVEHELRLIEQLKYESYFLTVHDLVRFARSRGILCQGRGSAANSAVCYCIGVTSVDPARIDLLFERFVSAARNEPPDIDIDFEHERREEVIQYVYDKYGRDRAGMTATLITYRGRSAVREVGKALGLSLDVVDSLARRLDWWHKGTPTAEQLRESGCDPDNPVMKRLVELVSQLLGFPRHLGQHTGGMVMTRGPLCELVPIENASMPDRTVIEWDKDDIDELGILKVDILGLGMLSLVSRALRMMGEGTEGPRDEGTKGQVGEGREGRRDEGTKGQVGEGMEGRRDEGTKGQVGEGREGERDRKDEPVGDSSPPLSSFRRHLLSAASSFDCSDQPLKDQVSFSKCPLDLFVGGDHPQLSSEIGLCHEFRKRTPGISQETEVVNGFAPSVPLGDVRRDRHCCTSHLRRETESLGVRHLDSPSVDQRAKTVPLLPCDQIPECPDSHLRHLTDAPSHAAHRHDFLPDCRAFTSDLHSGRLSSERSDLASAHPNAPLTSALPPLRPTAPSSLHPFTPSSARPSVPSPLHPFVPPSPRPSPPLSLHTIPPEDPAVYDMICEADTIGVFQIESRAQMSMLPRLRPRCFYDLVIEVAIVRPGPIQGNMVHPYLRRRSGEESVTYPSEALREVLHKTLGVPLFQEQAMKIAMVAAGFSAEEADQLRRAMAAWRRTDRLLLFRDKIVSGMLANGYTAEFAEQCFNQIKGFGEYGFPESHSASFALLVYVSCWLKRHRPSHFYCALLNSQPMGFYAPAQIVRDAREHAVAVRPVDVNFSEWDCTLEPRDPSDDHVPATVNLRHGWGRDHPALRLGFRQVKGLSREDMDRLVAARRRLGGFVAIEQVQREVGLRRDVIRRLAEADAFGSLERTRRPATWEALALDDADRPLFPDEREDLPPASLPVMPVGQEVLADYTTTGLSLKRHPVSLVRHELDRLGITTAAETVKLPAGRVVRVCGLVLVRQRPGTASGVVFITLEDETGVVNLVVWPRVYERFRPAARHAALLQCDGVVERQGQVVHVMARRLIDRSGLLAGVSFNSRDFH